MENDKQNSYDFFKELSNEELKNLLSEGMLSQDVAESVSDILRERQLNKIEKKKSVITFPNSTSREPLASWLIGKMIDVWGVFLMLFEKNKTAITLPNSASRAALASRLVAKIIDVWGLFLILYILISVLQNTLPSLREEIGYAGVCLGLAYFLLKDGIEGQSIGKRLCGIAVVHVADNTPCSWSASVVRNLIGFFGVLDLVYLFGSDRRRLGDLAAGTQVIKSTYLA